MGRCGHNAGPGVRRRGAGAIASGYLPYRRGKDRHSRLHRDHPLGQGRQRRALSRLLQPRRPLPRRQAARARRPRLHTGDAPRSHESDAVLNRGVSYGALGQYRRSIADYTAAITLDPRKADAWNARCYDRAIIGELEKALADCNKALQLQADSPEGRDSRGFLYLKLRQYGAAIADYDAALKLDPKKAVSLYGRGLAKHAKGDRTGGDADIAAAKALDASLPQLFREMGVRLR